MRVLLIVDMEGVSQVTDVRECWPAYPEYWRTGRQKMTADVVAAAQGLLDGGATAVSIRDDHGTRRWPNLFVDAFPGNVEMLGRTGRPDDFDASFHLGFHARCGTADGFISHTHVPEFRIRVNGALITESHDIAWSLGLPLLGITGDGTLGRELDDSLADVPFLGVQRSTSRTETTPVHGSAEESAAAIRSFARECARTWHDREVPQPPKRFTVEISMRPDLADLVYTSGKLSRQSDSVLALEGADWRRDARPAISAARQAALKPWGKAHGNLDLSSEATMLGMDPVALDRLRAYLDHWMHTNYPAWQD